MANYNRPPKNNGIINSIFNPQDYSTNVSSNDLLQQSLTTIQSSGSLQKSATYSSTHTYNYTNGLIYTLATNNIVMTTVSFINVPIYPQQSFVFKFFLTPTPSSSPYYLKPNTNFISINGTSYPLYGLSNISLPASYTILVQQITLINISTNFTPNFIALTSVLGH